MFNKPKCMTCDAPAGPSGLCDDCFMAHPTSMMSKRAAAAVNAAAKILEADTAAHGGEIPEHVAPRRDRYQTYVFDMEFGDAKKHSAGAPRDQLGPEYKGGVPVAWSDGHLMRNANEMLDFIRNLRDHEIDGNPAIAAEALMNRLKLG